MITVTVSHYRYGNTPGQSAQPGSHFLVAGVVRDFAYGSTNQPVAGVMVRISEGSGSSRRSSCALAPHATVEPIRRLIAGIVPDVRRIAIAKGHDIVARDLGRRRLGAWFFSGFGLIALVLGAGGVFGLVAYLAESRRREFGVRVNRR
jgi:hypothetical protein